MSKSVGAPSAEELGKQIEQLVASFMDASRLAAQAALDRAFAAAVPSPVVSRKKEPKSSGPRSTQSTPRDRRSSEDIRALADRFYDVVCQNPGETMMVLAPKLGASARTLLRPVAMLKRDGLIRMIGMRRHARYFPIARAAAG